MRRCGGCGGPVCSKCKQCLNRCGDDDLNEDDDLDGEALADRDDYDLHPE